MGKLNYKILWQQLARHLINKKPFKHRDELKMDHRFLEIYQQFVEKYGSHEKAAKKLYYHDEFTHMQALDGYYTRLGRSLAKDEWKSLIRKWEDLKRKPDLQRYIWLNKDQKKRDKRISRKR